jgi:hypothetical protein
MTHCSRFETIEPERHLPFIDKLGLQRPSDFVVAVPDKVCGFIAIQAEHGKRNG